jgi:hypothetical protein
MEEWYSKVRQLKDESVDDYKTEEICHRVFQDLKRLKIKDKGKFKQRMGPEFGAWTMSLHDMYRVESVAAIVNDDDFWNLTLRAVG